MEFKKACALSLRKAWFIIIDYIFSYRTILLESIMRIHFSKSLDTPVSKTTFNLSIALFLLLITF